MAISAWVRKAGRRSVFAMLCAAALAGTVQADELDALKGQTIRVIIGGAPTETTDVESRLFLTHLEKLLPQTTMRIQNQGGNSGATAIIELFGATGRVITLATFNYGAVMRQIAAPEATPFDIAQLKWVGSLSKVNRLFAMRKGLNGTTIETLRTLSRQPVAGTTGALTPATIEPLLLNALVGLRLKVVSGMTEAQRQAMIVAGDVDVRTGAPLEMVPLFESGEMFPVLKFTKEGYAASLDSVPTIAEAARPDAPKDVIFLMETLDRSGGGMIAAAPATEAADLAALRFAFAKVVADPAFLQAAERNRTPARPTEGARLAELVAQLVGKSSSVGDKVRAAIECGKRISDRAVAGCN